MGERRTSLTPVKKLTKNKTENMKKVNITKRKQITVFASVCLVAVAGLIYSSCSANEDAEAENASEPLEMVGTPTYVNTLRGIVLSAGTRQNVVEETEIVPALVDASKDYLSENEIDYQEFFEDENDPRIAVFAMAFAELDANHQLASGTRNTARGCVVEALGLAGLGMDIGKKAAAKIIAKAVLKRAIPYLGWGLFAIDYVQCISENSMYIKYEDEDDYVFPQASGKKSEEDLDLQIKLY